MVAYAVASSQQHRHHHHKCIHSCLKKIDSFSVCNSTCTHRQQLKPLEVFVDGQKIEPSSDTTLQDESVIVNGVNFDRNFYNTPATFSDILNFKGELMHQFYQIAQDKFKTPGHTYFPGSKLHLLSVPIPLEDSQFNNQEFMNKLLDQTPKDDYEFSPVSSLSFSEAYKEFLLGVDVDPNQLEGAPRSPEVNQEIKRREDQLEHMINEYMTLFERCNVAYEQYVAEQKLSVISYTLEHYTPQNGDCQAAEAKLNEHSRHSDDLSNYLTNLNPYNQLFQAIGQASKHTHNWNYAKDEIQRFTNYHRNMERSGVSPSNSEYQIPVAISRSFFNHNYFGGSSASFSETDIKAHLVFSGLGWKESAISPQSSWFDLNAIHKYRTHPQRFGRNFFNDGNGLLNRVPSYILISYKPVLKVKISRAMKEGFSNVASGNQLRPLETGPFVFTRVDLRTVNGGQVNEEFEMEMSSTLERPQIIAFRSTPIVYVPPTPPPPPPAYLQFIDKQVALRTIHGTYLRAVNEGDGGQVSTQDGVGRDEKWVIRNAGENKVMLMNSFGTYLRAYPGGDGAKVDSSVHQGDYEKFTIVQIDGKWALKSIHNTYIRPHGGVGAHVDVSPNLGEWERFDIDVLPTPLHVQFLNRRVSIRTAHNRYLRANPGHGSKVDQADNIGDHERWRIVYVGSEHVAFLSVHGTYLRSPPDQHIQHKKKKLFGSKKWTEVIPSRAEVQGGIDDCAKFNLIPVDAERIAIQSICQGKYLQALDNGQIGALPSIGGWEQFVFQLEMTPEEREPDCRYMALQLYREYLEREGEPDGVNGLVHSCIHTNTPVAQLKNENAQNFMNSPEFRGKVQEIVRTAYQAYLSRDADEAGLEHYTNHGVGLRVTLNEVRMNINQLLQNSGEGRTNQCKPIVIQLYRDYLDREPEEEAVTGGLQGCINSGTPIPNMRDEMAPGFRASAEYREKISEIVKNAYRVYLGREADHDGLEANINVGVALAVANIGHARDHINHEVANSREAQCKPLVAQLYRDYLEREGDAEGVNGGVANCIGSGTPMSGMRDEMSAGFRSSAEYRAKIAEVVKEAFRAYLFREADPEGLEGWTNNGVGIPASSFADARNQINHSVHQSREAQCKSVIMHLYRDYLEREAEPEGLNNAASNCIQSETPIHNIREEQAPGFRASQEFRSKVTDVVLQGYRSLLGREPSGEELEGWVNNVVSVAHNSFGDARNYVTHVITESREYQCRLVVTASYRTLLRREPDEGGYSHNMQHCLSRTDLSIDQVREEFHNSFINSEEYRALN
jgi:hypothetical protein